MPTGAIAHDSIDMYRKRGGHTGAHPRSLETRAQHVLSPLLGAACPSTKTRAGTTRDVERRAMGKSRGHAAAGRNRGPGVEGGIRTVDTLLLRYSASSQGDPRRASVPTRWRGPLENAALYSTPAFTLIVFGSQIVPALTLMLSESSSQDYL